MASFRLLLGALVLSLSSPALAEDAKPSYGTAPDTELPKSLRVPVSVLTQVGAERDQGPPRNKVKRQRTDCNQNGCGYKALLGGVPLAKDIQASESVSVRVIPTNSSLGGEANTRILVRARVDGQYGLHLRAKF